MTEQKFKGSVVDYVAESVKTLEAKVSEIQDSDSFRAYLTAQAKFHRYSFNNVLLIMAQYPEATQVAGFNSWKALDRNVLKGEKAIRILAPLRRRLDDDQETGEKQYGIYGFKAVPVFAYEQTEGKPLPEVPVPVLDSESGGELYGKLEHLAEEEGLRVVRGGERFRVKEHMMGYYEPQNRLIAVRDEISQLQATKTLAHEAGHHFAQHQESGAATETEAEGISYVVLAHHGLDSGERSFPYVATWASDKNVLRAALGNIQRVSSTIISRLDPQDKILTVGAAEGSIPPAFDGLA